VRATQLPSGGGRPGCLPDESLSSTSALLDLPNVTLTPHLAGASTNVVEHQSGLLLAGLAALADGSDAVRKRTVKNPDALEAR
jgi:phosphoglycerate dehydrogenase-like enzyme